MAKIFLHIGLEKTGSTSIQKFCELNKNLLIKRNVLFASGFFGRSNHVELTTAFCGEKNAGFLRKPVCVKKFIGSLREFILINKDVDIIFSNEHLSSRIHSEKALRELMEVLLVGGHKLVVICYIRNPADWLVSSYIEAVKSGYYGSAHNYFKMEGPVMPFDSSARDIGGILLRWKKVFSRHDVNFFSFDSAKKIGLIQHFIGNGIGLSDFEGKGIKNVMNTSFSGFQIKTILLVNRYFGYSSLGFLLRKSIIYFFNRVKFGKKLMLDKCDEEFLEKYSSDQSRKINGLISNEV